MAFPIVFIWFVLAILIFRHHLRKNTKAQDAVTNAFWKKEEASLIVRKKELDEEDYIHPKLSLEDLKGEAYYISHSIESLYRHEVYLMELLPKKMVNFNHLTNTELRLKYGTAMQTVIQGYEDHYNAYTNTLYKLASSLYNAGIVDYACVLLEEGLAVKTDNRKHLLLLAELYLQSHNQSGFEHLYEAAQNSQSLTKKALLESLDEIHKKSGFATL